MKKTLLATLLSTFAVGALADINIGVTLSATGPAASLGIPEKNTIDLLPKTIAGQKVNTSCLMMRPIPPPPSKTPRS